jgi:hypothetical protein
VIVADARTAKRQSDGAPSAFPCVAGCRKATLDKEVMTATGTAAPARNGDTRERNERFPGA